MCFRIVKLVSISVTASIASYLKRLQSKSTVHTNVLVKHLSVDDMTDNAKTDTNMQGAMNRVLHKSIDNYDLTGKTKRLEVVFQPAPGRLHSEPTITVNGNVLSRAVHIDDKFTARTVKTSVAFCRVCGNVWERNGIRFTLS